MCESKSSEDPCVLKLNLKGHKKPITAISFDPSGKQFVTSSEDNSLMVWNLMENVRSYNFTGHSDVVTDVEYSPVGSLLVSCSQDQTVRIWVPRINGASTDFRAHTSAVRTVAFSPDGSKILTGSNDKSVKLWNVTRKQFLTSFLGHNNCVRDVKFSPDAQIIASCSDDQTLRIWDSTSGQSIHVFRISSKGSPTSLSFHKNCNSLAVGLDSGSVRVYDVRMKKLQQHYVLHDSTTCVNWHPTHNFLLTSGKDGKIIVVDVMEGRPLYTIGGHEGAVSCVRFDKEGEYFASGGADRRVMVWKSNFAKK